VLSFFARKKRNNRSTETALFLQTRLQLKHFAHFRPQAENERRLTGAISWCTMIGLILPR
jgi:hypothetical protein